MAEYIAWWLTTMGDSAVEGVVGKTYDLKAVAAESLLQPWVYFAKGGQESNTMGNAGLCVVSEAGSSCQCI
jgi:hypothetical protein